MQSPARIVRVIDVLGVIHRRYHPYFTAGYTTDVCVSTIDQMMDPVVALTTCIVGTATIEPTFVDVPPPPP
jgi:hypothetical protein